MCQNRVNKSDNDWDETQEYANDSHIRRQNIKVMLFSNIFQLNSFRFPSLICHCLCFRNVFSVIDQSYCRAKAEHNLQDIDNNSIYVFYNWKSNESLVFGRNHWSRLGLWFTRRLFFVVNIKLTRSCRWRWIRSSSSRTEWTRTDSRQLYHWIRSFCRTTGSRVSEGLSDRGFPLGQPFDRHHWPSDALLI